MWELAEFCGSSVEDMFGISLPTPSEEEVGDLLAPTEPGIVDILHSLRLRAIAPGDIFHIRREGFIDLLREPTFATLDKYGPGVVVRPDEVGRFYGIPVILSDKVPADMLVLIVPG